MLDETLRRRIDRPAALAGRWLASAGIHADVVSVLGLTFGIAAALAIALGRFWIGLRRIVRQFIAAGAAAEVA